MNRVFRTCLVSFGLCAAMTMGSSLQAQPTPSSKEAVALYAKGKAALEKADFQAALAALEPSYAALASPNTLLLVAHAKRGLGRKLDAIKDYERVESDADSKVKAGEARYNATLAEARKWIETLTGELGKVSIRLEHASGTVVVRLNGDVVTLQSEGAGVLALSGQWVMPGHVELKVDVSGKTKETATEVTAGGKSTLTLDLAEKPAPAAPPPTPVEPEEKRSIPVGAWVAGGIGIAGLATFGVFAGLAKSDYDQLQSCSPRCPESDRATADSGKTKQTVANVGLIVGGVGVATALTFVLLAPKKSSNAPTVGLGLGPGAFTVRGTF